MILQNEDSIEKFIRENRDNFAAHTQAENHMGKFLVKLNRRVRNFINIVPYLIKVSIVTILIFASSLIVWNNFIRKDRHYITLGNKISLVISKIRKQQ